MDLQAFMAAQLEPRTAEITVDGLQPFFADGAPPVWKVRSLSAAEYLMVLEAEKSNANVAEIAKAIADRTLTADALKAMIGLSERKQPVEIMRRLELLVRGTVAPVVTYDVAVKFAGAFPVDFWIITGTIVQLTGLGYDLKKPTPSGQETMSAP